MNGKYTFKTVKSPLAQTKKKNEMRDNRENSAKDRSVEFGVNPKKTIMHRWPYLLHSLLDRAAFSIYFSSHMLILTGQRDRKAHNPFDKNHHQKFHGKQKEIHLQSSFDRQLMSLSSTIESCLFLDM